MHEINKLRLIEDSMGWSYTILQDSNSKSCPPSDFKIGLKSTFPARVRVKHDTLTFVTDCETGTADEFPEFHRDVINALREPLEDRVVSISRAKGSAIFPASFMLIAALNPCPCGFSGSPRCACMPHAVEKYRRKISGPVADRIDLWVHVGEMPPESLSTKVKGKKGETIAARQLVGSARARQRERFKDSKGIFTNADMKPKHIEAFADLTEKAENTLVGAARSMKLSPRGYHRTIKLARTIADLANSDRIEPPHMLEALQYRAREI